MFVEIINGLDSKPIRLPATQVIVRMANGSPIMAAAQMGPDGMLGVGIVGDEMKPGDFKRVLRYCGVKEVPPIETLRLGK